MRVKAVLFLMFEVLRRLRAQQCNSDILFILDASGSVAEDFHLMEKYIKGASTLLSIFPGGHRVALIEYSGQWINPIIVRFGEIQSNAEFQKRLNNLTYLRGTTFTGTALRSAVEILRERRKDALTVVFVVTDGFHHDPDEVIKWARKIRQMPDLEMFCAAVPQHYNKQGMLEVAGSFENLLFPPNLIQKTRQILMPIIGCMQKFPPPTTTTVTTTLATTTQYRITGCEMDLLLIVDFSSSVMKIVDEYVTMAKSLINSLRIGRSYTQVALIKYSSTLRTRAAFHFNDYDTADSLVEAIERLQRVGGLTDTNKGCTHTTLHGPNAFNGVVYQQT